MHESRVPHATLEKYLTETPLQVLATSEALGWNNANLLIIWQLAMVASSKISPRVSGFWFVVFCLWFMVK